MLRTLPYQPFAAAARNTSMRSTNKPSQNRCDGIVQYASIRLVDNEPETAKGGRRANTRGIPGAVDIVQLASIRCPKSLMNEDDKN